jgi:nuclear GTP-binding protein
VCVYVPACSLYVRVQVIDSSDVVIEVLDARHPLGTRCLRVEKHLKEDAPHKHLIFLLNKCDLVPTGVTVRRC